MKCFNKKKQHIGKLQILRRYDLGWNEKAVVRWCPNCGAVVIDQESDGRLFGSFVKMLFPQITKETLRKPKQRSHKSVWEEEWTR